jgi:hypothetical protein
MDNLRRLLKLVGGVSMGLVLLTAYVVAPAMVLFISVNAATGLAITSNPIIAPILPIAAPGTVGVAGALLLALYLRRWQHL